MWVTGHMETLKSCLYCFCYTVLINLEDICQTYCYPFIIADYRIVPPNYILARVITAKDKKDSRISQRQWWATTGRNLGYPAQLLHLFLFQGEFSIFKGVSLSRSSKPELLLNRSCMPILMTGENALLDTSIDLTGIS